MPVSDLKKLFEVEVSEYWHNHFVFDTPSVYSEKTISQETIDLLLINVVAPFLFFYGKTRKEEEIKDRALELLNNLKSEKNVITEGWQNLGIEVKNAARSQSLIQLKTEYCDKKQCVNCAVGVSILKNMT